MAKLSLTSCIAEFVGTFILVFTIGCNVLGMNGTWGGVAIASVLMVNIYAFGAASGANFNPAVSVALGIANKQDDGWKQVGAYCGIQAGAAIAAALLYGLLFGGGFQLEPKPGYVTGAIICEVLYTFMLCFVVLNTAASRKWAGKNQFYGLAIGFVIVAGGYGSVPFGAGCFNPAVALGITASGLFMGFGWCLLYMAAELVGAVLAVAVFYVVRPEERDETDAPKKYGLRSALVAEGVGTYMLVLTVGLNVLGLSKATAYSIAATLMCMIYATGDVSGGHFNPAVTLAIQLSGRSKLEVKTAVYYVLAQIGSAVLASYTYALAHGGLTFPLGPGVGRGWCGVFFVETIFTAMFATVVLCVTREDCKMATPEVTAFVIGSCITAGSCAAAPVSGGSLNPAVSVGIAAAQILNGGFFFKALLYSACELLGAAAAAGIFKTIYPEGSKDAKSTDEEQGTKEGKKEKGKQGGEKEDLMDFNVYSDVSDDEGKKENDDKVADLPAKKDEKVAEQGGSCALA